MDKLCIGLNIHSTAQDNVWDKIVKVYKNEINDCSLS